jgi:hypothetical protein
MTITRIILGGLLVLIPAGAGGDSPADTPERPLASGQAGQAGEGVAQEGEAAAEPSEEAPQAGAAGEEAPAPGEVAQDPEPAQTGAEEAGTGEPVGEAAEAPAAEPGSATAEVGSIARAQFTTRVVEREPVDELETVTTEQDEIYFFTDLRDCTGQTITHRWERQGQVLAEVPFQVGGPRWRVYSRKTLQPGMTGEWTVTVLDGEGDALETRRFTYVEATAPKAPQPAETAPEEPRGPARPAMKPSSNGPEQSVGGQEKEGGAPAEEQPPPAAQEP